METKSKYGITSKERRYFSWQANGCFMIDGHHLKRLWCTEGAFNISGRILTLSKWETTNLQGGPPQKGLLFLMESLSVLVVFGPHPTSKDFPSWMTMIFRSFSSLYQALQFGWKMLNDSCLLHFDDTQACASRVFKREWSVSKTRYWTCQIGTGTSAICILY